MPAGIAVDESGNVYIADTGTSRVRKISPDGIIATVAGNGVQGFGGDGGPATVAQLSWPIGVALDIAGNLYIADCNNNRIRRVDGAGIISTVSGDGTPGYSGDGGPSSDAELKFPAFLAFDSSGNLYITTSDRVRRISTDGAITTGRRRHVRLLRRRRACDKRSALLFSGCRRRRRRESFHCERSPVPRTLLRFLATTRQSAPQHRIRTLALVVQSTCSFSVTIDAKVLMFHTTASSRFRPPLCRMPLRP